MAVLVGGVSPLRPDRAVHHPGKVLLDVATTVALGGFAPMSAFVDHGDHGTGDANDERASRWGLAVQQRRRHRHPRHRARSTA